MRCPLTCIQSPRRSLTPEKNSAQFCSRLPSFYTKIIPTIPPDSSTNPFTPATNDTHQINLSRENAEHNFCAHAAAGTQESSTACSPSKQICGGAVSSSCQAPITTGKQGHHSATAAWRRLLRDHAPQTAQTPGCSCIRIYTVGGML